MTETKHYLTIILFLFTALAAVAGNSQIQSGNTVGVWVKGEPELTVDRKVGSDGSIRLPLIGSVGVSGMRTTDAAKVIASIYKDGYLRSPMVQVTIKASTQKQTGDDEVRLISDPTNTITADTTSAAHTEAQASPPTGPLMIKLVSSKDNSGIGGVAMMLGNRIYQSNRLGQIIVNNAQGHVIIIADGHLARTGSLKHMLSMSSPPKIVLDPVPILDTVTFVVLDAKTHTPLSNVNVKLGDMKIRTNNRGSFIIRENKKEFGEIELSCRGYKAHRQVIDFKGPETQTILLVKNE